MDEPTNYLGAVIFWLYIVFALVFTGKTLQTLYVLYTTTYRTKKQKHTKQLWLFSALALFSFATLSTTMLNVLFQSFDQWSLLPPIPGHETDTLPTRIWHWSTTSTLFTDFAEGLVQDSARFFWAQAALLATLSTTIYMGTEGRQRNIPNLWTFFALGQILPISFAQNLFYIALLLTNPEPKSSETEEKPTNSNNTTTTPNPFRILHYPKPTSILSAAAYCLTLALAQLYSGTPALTPLILLARASLLTPLLLPAQFYPSAAAVPDPKKAPKRATGDELQRVVLKTSLIMTGMKGYQAFQEGFSIEGVTVALWGHPAVLVFGVDLVVVGLGFAGWNWFGPMRRGVGGVDGGVDGGAGVKAKAPVGGTGGKERRRDVRAAARKSGGGGGGSGRR